MVRQANFVPRSNKRTARIVPSHKKAVEGHKAGRYNIKLVEGFDHDKIREFVFENTSTVVTQISEDPLHNCRYMCKECKTCFHQFICSCEEHRVQRHYCRHLCAVGCNKKLRFQFETNVSSFKDVGERYDDLDFGVRLGCEDGFDNDLGCGNGYDTDDAPESSHILQQILTNLPKEAVKKPIALEDCMKAIDEQVSEYYRAINEQPHRMEEYFNEILSATKRFKLIHYSNLNEVVESQEKSRKRKLATLTRQSPTKSAKKNS